MKHTLIQRHPKTLLVSSQPKYAVPLRLLPNPDNIADDTVSFLILSSAEVIVAIICACWPVVVPIFIKHVRETTRFLNTKPRRTGLNDGFSEIQSSDRGSAPELARAPRENATDGLGFEDGHDLQVFSEGHKGHLSLDPDEIHMTTDVEVRLDKRYPSRSKLLRNI